MSALPYQPVFELTRGSTVETIHFGAAAVVDAAGRLVASIGNPDTVTFLRSTAKPFQALPFVERGGPQAFCLTPREVALMCSSHSGTDEHVALVEQIQRKVGVSEADLLCGTHPPSHQPTADAMRARHEEPTPNRHNCSGKHTGMLACTLLQHLPKEDYINFSHPLQAEILKTFAEMCGLEASEVELGIDGCSAPNFAVPLRHAAWAFARLSDPAAGGVQPQQRAAACRMITAAMMANPDMVGGPGRFDTRLMDVGRGRMVVKGGAEGYQGVGILPGALGPGSPAMGIALKISDGDLTARARPAVVLEVLRQLGVLPEDEVQLLGEFGPCFPVHNWRMIEVGQGRPCFRLNWNRTLERP